MNAALIIPTVFPLLAGGKDVGIFYVLKGMPTNHFAFVGTHFKTHPGFQRDGKFLWLGVSNRGGERPVGREFQRGQSTLGRRHPMEGSALRGRKNPKKPAVSWHTTLLAKSSVLYLWRPWVRKGVVRGGNKRFPSATEQAGSASSRTRSPGVC